MSEPTDVRPTGALPPEAPARRGGCVGRFVSALLVVLITTVIATAAVVLIYLFVLETPGQIAELRGRAATAEAQNAELRAQSGAMQTEIAALADRDTANREALGELQRQKADLDTLRDDLENAGRENATVVAEARASRDAVALYATAESGRVELLDALKRRSERIERFLQRLSDISDDAALDLGSGTPSVPPTPVPDAPVPSPGATDTPAPPPTPEPTGTPTPVATATRLPTATVRPLSTGVEAPTAPGGTLIP
jgi:hypothetical protein